MLLENKVALITGAASGIGRATAKLFASEGAKVAVVDVNEAGGKETADGIDGGRGHGLFVRADVGKMVEVDAMVQTVLDHYGRLDVVHSNAAAFTMGTATEITEDQWDRTIAVCLKATWMIAHHAVPPMLESGGGTIVITGSVHAIRGYARCSSYQAAKGGLLALTRSLAAEYGPAIRVNSILPGAVDTEAWSAVTEEERNKMSQMSVLKRNGRPEDIAKIALFLASDLSSYVTGTYVVADGGLTSIVQLPEDM